MGRTHAQIAEAVCPASVSKVYETLVSAGSGRVRQRIHTARTTDYGSRRELRWSELACGVHFRGA
jgi:hypothetical protein